MSVRASNQDTALDIWDGETTDIAWYKENLTEYTIKTAAEFAGVSYLTSQGIDFKGVTLYLDSDLDMTAGDFKPVGYITKTIQSNTGGYTEGYVCGVPFRGNFNGGGHTISVNISESYADGGGYKVSYLGLFGYIDHSIIENVTVTGYVSGSCFDLNQKANRIHL